MANPLGRVIVLAAAAVLLSGCTLASTSQSTAKSSGGVWRSNDGAKTFVQTNDLMATRGRILTLNTADINSLTLDPQDPLTVYAASTANGIFYTIDGGNSWQQFKALTAGSINDISVDSQNKCVIYATAANKLFKTENCGRDWNNIYYHQKSQVVLTALAVDPKNGGVVYLGTSEGEVLKSLDGGHAWVTSHRIQQDKIMDIVIDPFESRIVFVGSAKKGLFKSLTGGASWSSLGAGLESYVGSHEYRKLIYDAATPNSLLFISKFGLLKTVDGGNTWRIIELLPAHKTTNILMVAVNPADSNEFYYATASTLVKTSDGGVSWSSKQLPYSRLTTDIKISPASGNTVYLATKQSNN